MFLIGWTLSYLAFGLRHNEIFKSYIKGLKT
jgi:hypothetical protein